MALSPYDQSVYDAGYKYIPQSQYLLNPFSIPQGGGDAPTGIATTYQAQNMMGGGGGGGFNPYNPDMSRVRTDYRPNFDFRAYQDFDGRYGDSLETMDRKQMDMYPDYYGVNTGVPKTGIGAAFSKIADFIPYVGTMKRIAGFMKDKLPINQRSILENELRGSGVLTDDIGRIVAQPGGYNTPEGIMAGYNAAKMTDATFDKRTGNMRETLKNKYDLTDKQVDGLISGELTEDDFTGSKYQLPSGKISNLFSNIRNIELAKRNFINKQRKADQIVEFEKAQRAKQAQIAAMARTQNISRQEAQQQQQAIDRDSAQTEARGRAELGSSYDEGTYCFDPNTLIQMADGSEKKIKEIQLGDQTKGGEVTGVFQFKASDEIHDYKGVTVAGSHYVKEDGRFIMVKDSPISVKIDKIPVVYSLDTTGRRIFIKDIEFADYNGDGIAKGFLANAGVDISGFEKEVLRQVENRLI